jgi:hypothetical protein
MGLLEKALSNKRKEMILINNAIISSPQRQLTPNPVTDLPPATKQLAEPSPQTKTPNRTSSLS